MLERGECWRGGNIGEEGILGGRSIGGCWGVLGVLEGGRWEKIKLEVRGEEIRMRIGRVQE